MVSTKHLALLPPYAAILLLASHITGAVVILNKALSLREFPLIFARDEQPVNIPSYDSNGKP